MLEQVKPSGAEKENKLYDEERPNKKLEDELRKKYSGIVYHYCSLDTFLKLLQIIQSEHQIYENRMITMK